ncbi:YceI family protein [Antarcticibacterium flavum]|uniref:YceI family protein n=1 Tax=Antarcticibacterium flavum TaxID=2058175 RepID=A0A5B7X478_9FLAO|nr:MULTISPECIES: YceI family protein [Antarcticibacterium]MCM4158314.1 YceI family protein [Antarcticibacterium sp. W02-3]QCY70080.1 YceI family protein [Antarcticibacterium flavum]
MNTLKNLKLVLGSILMMVVTTQISIAQTYNLNNSASNLKIEGTSNVHDWEIEAKDQKGKLVAELDNGQLVKISQLEFTVVAESLKSGKSGMDKNTYKALKTDKNKNITYKLNKVNNIDCVSSGSCKVVTSGTLNIAGSSRPIDITFDAKVSGDKITLTGSQELKMTDYKVDPPTAMFGTITTGDKVNVKFQTTFSK